MSQWFPRLNVRGEIVSEAPGQWQAGWFNEHTRAWHNGSQIVIEGRDPIPAPGITLVTFGNSNYAWTDGKSIFRSWGETIENASDPTLSANGTFAYVSNPNSNDKVLYCEGREIARGIIIEPRVSNTAIAWMQNGVPCGLRLDNGLLAQIAPDGGRPVPIDTPDGPWVLIMRAGGVWLAPLGSDQGHFFDRKGQAFNPDAVCLGQEIVCAFTDERGNLDQPRISLDAPRAPFVTEPDVIVIDPPVIDPEKPMPDSLEGAVRAERAKYPATLTIDQPGKILNKVAWDENERLDAEEWGMSAKPNGNHVPSPQGVDIAYDILHHKPTNTLWGCGTGEWHTFTVNWGLEPYHNDPDGRPWVAPIQPDGVIFPPLATHQYDGGEHDDGTCDKCGQPRGAAIHVPVIDPKPDTLRAEVDALKAVVARQAKEISATEAVAEAAHVMAVQALESLEAMKQDAPSYRIISDPQGQEFSTGSRYGHAHPIKLRIEKV